MRIYLTYLICAFMVMRLYMLTIHKSEKVIGFRFNIMQRFYLFMLVMGISLAIREYVNDGLFYGSLIGLVLNEFIFKNENR